MITLQITAPVNYGMHRGFLASYEQSVDNFMADMKGVGCDIDTSDFASIVLELKHNTLVAYQYLSFFKEKTSTYLLDFSPEQLQLWVDKFYQLICTQLQGTLGINIKTLIRKHRELFHFTCRDVCQHTTCFLEHPERVKEMDFGPMVICELYVMNKRFYNMLRGCIREQQKRTDEDVIRIFRERWEEYKKTDGEAQINYLKQSCNRLSKNGKLTQTQYDLLSENILNEIDDPTLRRIIKVNWEKPISMIKALRAKGYGEEVMEEVFCACTKLEELERIYEQKEEPEELNYDQKRIAFLTECVKDIQAASYSKDGDRLIRGYNEWFYVFRIFEEKKVKGLNNCKNFVEELYKLDIKVMKLPPSAENLYKTKQEFKERFLFPNWVSPDSISNKFPRILELGAATLKAYEKHKHLLG